MFQVKTLDGRTVWRRRRYRVRRASVPGAFFFSTLDNGVVSKEYWRIIDCADDLSYCLFYYSGAASAAGLSYTGAVMGTKDGKSPAPQYAARIAAALETAGLKPWELSPARIDEAAQASAPLALSDI